MCENHETKHLSQPINVQDTHAPDQSCDSTSEGHNPLPTPKTSLAVSRLKMYFTPNLCYFRLLRLQYNLISVPFYFMSKLVIDLKAEGALRSFSML